MTASRVTRATPLGVLAATLAAAALAAPAGARLAYEQDWQSPHPSVWTARDDGSSPRRLATGSSPRISPDARLVAYVRHGAHGAQRLLVVPTMGGAPRRLHRNAAHAAWSRDSRTLAAVTLDGPRRRLVTIDVASGAIHVVATADDFRGASFAPARDRIAYAALSIGPRRVTATILQARIDGRGRAIRLTGPRSNVFPVWGPRWIAFAHEGRPPADGIAKAQIYLVKPSGARLHRLTREPPGRDMFGFTPVDWDAGGRRLLAAFNGMATDHAVTVDPATGRVRHVGRAADVAGADLSRDGRTILGTMRDPASDASSIVTLPYGGGIALVRVPDAIGPSWSR